MAGLWIFFLVFCIAASIGEWWRRRHPPAPPKTGRHRAVWNADTKTHDIVQEDQ